MKQSDFEKSVEMIEEIKNIEKQIKTLKRGLPAGFDSGRFFKIQRWFSVFFDLVLIEDDDWNRATNIILSVDDVKAMIANREAKIADLRKELEVLGITNE